MFLFFTFQIIRQLSSVIIYKIVLGTVLDYNLKLYTQLSYVKNLNFNLEI